MAHEGSAAFAAERHGAADRRARSLPGHDGARRDQPDDRRRAARSSIARRSWPSPATCPTHQLGRRVQMVIDHHALFRPITKATCPLRDAARRPLRCASAVVVALSEPPGPCISTCPRTSRSPRPTDVCAAGRRARGLPPPATSRSSTRVGQIAARGASPGGRHRRVGSAHAQPGRCCVRSSSTHRLAVRDDDDGQGDDRRGSPAVDRLHRARAPAGAARAFCGRRTSSSASGTTSSKWSTSSGSARCRWRASTSSASTPTRRSDRGHEAVGDLDESLERLVRQPAGRARVAAATPRRVSASAFQAALRPAAARLHAHRGDRRRAAPCCRAEGILAFDVGAHTHQIASQWTAHAPGQFLVHEQLVVDGVRHPSGDRREARPARPCPSCASSATAASR